jgi:hypothetical protein
MLFLIEYDRQRGALVTFRTFPSSEQQRADEARLELELHLNRLGVDHEVVLLEAANENALRRSHRRYFEDVAGIAGTPAPR